MMDRKQSHAEIIQHKTETHRLFTAGAFLFTRDNERIMR